VVYGYGVRCSIADHKVVGAGVISDASGMLCGALCEVGEQATAIEKINTVTAANGPGTFECFLNVIFSLLPPYMLDSRGITCYNGIGGNIIAPISYLSIVF